MLVFLWKIFLAELQTEDFQEYITIQERADYKTITIYSKSTVDYFSVNDFNLLSIDTIRIIPNGKIPEEKTFKNFYDNFFNCKDKILLTKEYRRINFLENLIYLTFEKKDYQIEIGKLPENFILVIELKGSPHYYCIVAEKIDHVIRIVHSEAVTVEMPEFK